MLRCTVLTALHLADGPSNINLALKVLARQGMDYPVYLGIGTHPCHLEHRKGLLKTTRIRGSDIACEANMVPLTPRQFNPVPHGLCPTTCDISPDVCIASPHNGLCHGRYEKWLN